MTSWAEEQGWRRPLAVSFGFVLIAIFVAFGALGIAAGVAIGALLALPSLHRLKSLLPLELTFAVFLIFIAWVWASASWSTYPNSQQAWKMTLGAPLYALFAYGVWTLRGKGRLLALYVALGSLLFLIALYALEAGFGIVSYFYDNEESRMKMIQAASRGASALVCAGPAAWAFLSMLIPGWRGVAGGVLFAALTFVICWHFGLSAGMLAVILASVVFIIGWFIPRTSILLVTLFSIAAFLLAPIVMPYFLSTLDIDRLPFSWAIRVENWQFALERIAERPLFGWGLDASRTFQHTYQMHGYDLPNISMHPHNVGLQLWLETGFIGALLFSITILILAIRVSTSWNLSRSQGAAIAASSAAFFVFCLFSYGAWQEWFWGCFAWISALCVLIGPEPEKATEE